MVLSRSILADLPPEIDYKAAYPAPRRTQAPDDPLTSGALFPSSKHDPGAGHNPAENLLYVCCVALQQGLDGAGIITTASLSSPERGRGQEEETGHGSLDRDRALT